MEKILTHYAGNIKLDPESLKSLANSIDKTPGHPETAIQSRPQSPGSDYLGVDDENFTVKPLDNNTTRKFLLAYYSHDLSTTSLTVP